MLLPMAVRRGDSCKLAIKRVSVHDIADPAGVRAAGRVDGQAHVVTEFDPTSGYQREDECDG